jgi:hypothetical protein
MLATVTVAVPEMLPSVAFTVIAVPAAAEPAVRVAIADPVASVVACVTVMSPALAVNAILAPDTTALFASFATAVRVELVLPSEAMVAVLAPTVMVATVLVVVGVHCEAVLPLSQMISDELPPQAVSHIVVKANQAIIENLRMSTHPSPDVVSALAISTDWNLHAEFSA